jgi:hypothetical protein
VVLGLLRLMIDLSDCTVFLLGGGPTLTASLAELEVHLDNKEIRKWRIFAINESMYCAPYADLLFFRDTTWYLANKTAVDAWSTLVVTSTASKWYSSNVRVVKMKHCEDFLIGGDIIKYGRSAGHTALSLAISLGAKKCVLLGYDCRLVDGRTHFHEKPADAIAITYKEYFLPAWVGWGDAVERAGVEVVNATPDSAILSFPRRPLSEVLAND